MGIEPKTSGWEQTSLGLKSGFESPDLSRPGRQLHQQGLGEARLGCRDGSPPKRAPGPYKADKAGTEAYYKLSLRP